MYVNSPKKTESIQTQYPKHILNGYVYNIPKKGVYVSDIDLKQSHSNQIVKVLQPLKDSGIQKQELMDAIEILYKENATC